MQSLLTIQHPEPATTNIPDLSHAALAFLAAFVTIHPVAPASSEGTAASEE